MYNRAMQIPSMRKMGAGLGSFVLGRNVATVEDRNYRNLLLSGAWFGPIEGGIFTYLSVFLARLGATPSVISLMTSLPSLIGIVTFLPGGAYIERQSNLVRVLVRAVFLSRIVYPVIALAPLFVPTAYLPIVIVLLWTLASLPSAIHIPAFAAIMQKAIPTQRRAKFNGTRWGLMAFISGLMIALFGFMLDRSAFPLGYQIVFMISFGAAMMNMYYFSKVEVPPFVRDPDKEQPHQGATTGESAALPRLVRLRHFLRAFTAHPAFVRYNAASFAFRLTLTMPAGLFSVYWVTTLNASDTWIGLRGTSGYAALVLGYWFWGRMASRIGHRGLLLICGAGVAFYPALTALAPSVVWLLPAAVLWGFTVSGIDIGLFDMLLISSPAGRMPSFAALANVLNNVSLAIGPLLGAALAGLVGTRTALLVIGGLQLFATLGFLLLPNREQEKATAQRDA
jgi:MFS family permease